MHVYLKDKNHHTGEMWSCENSTIATHPYEPIVEEVRIGKAESHQFFIVEDLVCCAAHLSVLASPFKQGGLPSLSLGLNHSFFVQVL
jgi:hypothetical protein